ncbi:MAG: LiaI-LiaF-like domain-containing protein, partial [Terriglobales bacterium]
MRHSPVPSGDWPIPVRTRRCAWVFSILEAKAVSDTTTSYPVRARQCGRGLFGPLVLIALGVIFLLDQLHILSAHHAFAYFWPVVFIIFGIELLSWRAHGPRAVLGVIVIVIGAGLIASNLGYWYFDVGRWWPLILILVGLSLLFRRGWGGPENPRLRRYRHQGFWAGDASASG